MTTLTEDLIRKVGLTMFELSIVTKAELHKNIASADIIDTGALGFDISTKVRVLKTKADMVVKVPAKYASYQDEGTGIHAGRGVIQYPFPHTFYWRRMNTVVSMSRINGTPKTRFFTKVIEDIEHHLLEDIWRRQ